MTTATSTDTLTQQIEALEKELQAKQKELVKLRKQAPKREVSDYVFLDTSGNQIKLSEMFGDKDELMVVHNMGKSCRYCTLWADEYNGIVKPLQDRVPFYVTSPDDWQTAKEFAESRNWNFKLLSTKENSFKKDMDFEPKDGDYHPGVSTFEKDADGKMFLIVSAGFGPGDLYSAFWHYLDLLPKGHNKWEPKYKYQ